MDIRTLLAFAAGAAAGAVAAASIAATFAAGEKLDELEREPLPRDWSGWAPPAVWTAWPVEQASAMRIARNRAEMATTAGDEE